MKRFSFSLERVRKWRRDHAEIEEMRLRTLGEELHAIEAQQTQVAEETTRVRTAVTVQPLVTAEDLQFVESFRDWAAKRMRRLEAMRKETETRFLEQRRRLLEAQRAFELLDGLRDKALVSWTAARNKEEEDLAGELFLAKRSRERRLK